MLAGFAGEAACLATAIDAFHRGHAVTFLADASASHALDDVAANDVHRVVSSVAGLYGEVLTTKSWIARTSRKNNWRGQGDGKQEFPLLHSGLQRFNDCHFRYKAVLPPKAVDPDAPSNTLLTHLYLGPFLCKADTTRRDRRRRTR